MCCFDSPDGQTLVIDGDLTEIYRFPAFPEYSGAIELLEGDENVVTSVCGEEYNRGDVILYTDCGVTLRMSGETFEEQVNGRVGRIAVDLDVVDVDFGGQS